MKAKITAITEKYPEFVRLFKFCFVGVLNTLIYYTVYYMLVQIDVHFTLAATAGTIIGIINSFIWNKLFVFKAGKKLRTGEIIKFGVVYTVQYVCNLGMLHLFINYIGLSEEISGLIAACICPFISYTGLRFWGFKQNGNEEPEENKKTTKSNPESSKIKRNTGSFALFIFRIILFAVPVIIFFLGQRYFYEDTLFFFWGNIVVLVIYTAVLYLSGRIYNGFNFGNAGISEIIFAWIMCLIITNTLQYFILSLLVEALLPLRGFGYMLGCQILFVIPMSIIINAVYYYLNPPKRTLIIYGKKEKLPIYKSMIGKQQKRFTVADTRSQREQIGALLDAINKAEAVFFLNVDESKQELFIEYCYLNDKHTYVLPTFSRVLFHTAGTIWLSNTPVFALTKPEPDTGALMVKRLIDIVVSLAGIIITSPIMLIVAVIIRLTDMHPALYKQIRVTRGARRFKMYKFRSMIPNAEDDGVLRLAAKDDPRITHIGRFIRRTRIDELPQLFNVLSGTMSLVGPRPERPEIASMYEEIYPNFAFRTKVKAGITGFAQIYGRYNTAPEDKLFLDIMYIETFSILQDLKLMLQTIGVLFRPASTEGIENDSITALR